MRISQCAMQIILTNPRVATQQGMTNFLLILVTLIPLRPILCQRNKMLDLLRYPYYPWFGDSYKPCNEPGTEWPKCYNLLPDYQQSVLERAGIYEEPSLTTELLVTFSAPTENVDICGKSENVHEIKEFMLDKNGKISDELLDLGAEIYRRQPNVQWNAQLGVLYSLIFWDVGFFKIRGWFFNIEKIGEELRGSVLVPYYPPANPTPNTNPILIMLLQQREKEDDSRADEIINFCVLVFPSVANAHSCRSVVSAYIRDSAVLVGLQIYYTNGKSLYEKFRACTESFMCDRTCTDSFNGFFKQHKNAGTLKSINRVNENLDFYVNIRFSSEKNEIIKIDCCDEQFLRPRYEFLPRPGNDYTTDYIAQVDPNVYESRMTLEIAGSNYTFQEHSNTFYTVVMIGYKDSKCDFYTYLFVSDIKLPAINVKNTNEDALTYEPPENKDGKMHTYYILLYSHEGRKNIDMESLDRCDYLKSLGTAVLRSVSWFKAEDETVCDKIDCKANLDEKNATIFIGNLKLPTFKADITVTQPMTMVEKKTFLQSTGTLIVLKGERENLSKNPGSTVTPVIVSLIGFSLVSFGLK